MDNLIFCLNATIPIFLLMVLGYIFKKINLFSDAFIKNANAYVFKVALPALVFKDLAGEDFAAVWDGKYVAFCFVVTLICISISIALSFVFGRKERGEFIQSSYRSSAALLGIGFIQNVYGTSGMAPLMIIGTVPLYNIMAVIALCLFAPDNRGIDKKVIKTTLKDIATNPIILGILVGLIWAVLHIPQPVIMQKTISYLAATTTPIGLMAMGAGFEFKKCSESIKEAAVATFLKLVAWCAAFLPLAVWLGYTTDKLLAVLVMLGSPTTVSCYIMAKNMGHEGTLSTTTVMLTSLLSAFTLTGWLYVLKSFGLI